MTRHANGDELLRLLLDSVEVKGMGCLHWLSSKLALLHDDRNDLEIALAMLGSLLGLAAYRPFLAGFDLAPVGAMMTGAKQIGN